ncbi:unnamed protein product, partial [Mesorhabditis belari]|uniref:Arginase n=1 Tax=Mesorhabditis belari TaxID=2138241 RepID=A0AAF3J567_9BILA
MRLSLKQLFQQISAVGCANGLAGRQLGCESAAHVLQNSSLLKQCRIPVKWEAIVKEVNSGRHLDAMPGVRETMRKLADQTRETIKKEGEVLVVAGDHSSAIGTWSGVSTAMRDVGEIGLIWIDAHMDAHTPATSGTGNIHGMPVAHLLGYGDSHLASIGDNFPKIRPENLCLVGIRSFEPAEQQLLDYLGVRVFFMEEVERRGIAEVMQEAHHHVTRQTSAFGMSIDIDGFDVADAPAVGTPEKDGIRADEFLQALLRLDLRGLIATEIVEFLPKFDDAHKTSEKLVVNLIETIYQTKFFQTQATESILRRAHS